MFLFLKFRNENKRKTIVIFIAYATKRVTVFKYNHLFSFCEIESPI